MPTIVSPPVEPAQVRVLKPTRPAEVVRLEAEAERLQREVRASTVRNTAIAQQSTAQAREVKTFEVRTRDALRDLVSRMQQDDDDKRR